MEFFKLFLTDYYTEEKTNLLQCITVEHFKFFQKQVDKVLFDVKLPMTLKEETFFRKNKEILRTISQRKFSSFVGYFLGSHINLVKEVIKVTHKNNESHPSDGAGSSGNMEKNQSQDAGTDEESSDTEPSSPESVSYRDEDQEEEDEDENQDNATSSSSYSSNSSTYTTSGGGGGEEEEEGEETCSTESDD